jgi:hypothetical protein
MIGTRGFACTVKDLSRSEADMALCKRFGIG